jgi:hypothetical protein
MPVGIAARAGEIIKLLREKKQAPSWRRGGTFPFGKVVDGHGLASRPSLSRLFGRGRRVRPVEDPAATAGD